MEWDIGLETNFDDLMEVISPGLDKEFNNFILDGRFGIIKSIPKKRMLREENPHNPYLQILGTSFQHWSPSPVSPTSDEMTQGFGKLDINMDSSVGTTWKCERSKNFPFHSLLYNS